MSEVFVAALINAICAHESGGNPRALNPSDKGSPSYGQCQIKEVTARELGFKGSVVDLWLKPELNRYWARKYLERQLRRYKCPIKAIAAYNAGSVKDGKIRNTKYVQKVMQRLELAYVY